MRMSRFGNWIAMLVSNIVDRTQAPGRGIGRAPVAGEGQERAAEFGRRDGKCLVSTVPIFGRDALRDQRFDYPPPRAGLAEARLDIDEQKHSVDIGTLADRAEQGERRGIGIGGADQRTDMRAHGRKLS